MPKKKSVSLAGTKPKCVHGPDGTVVEARRVRTGTVATSSIKVRGRPGTFEWRYGRFGNSQYHAGAMFSRLWERAGIASAGNFSWEASNSSGQPSGGISDARLMAMDRLRSIGRAIGGPMQRRLVAYCVEGRTPKEIAASYGGQVSDRQISDTLDVDLLELAQAMGFAR